MSDFHTIRISSYRALCQGLAYGILLVLFLIFAYGGIRANWKSIKALIAPIVPSIAIENPRFYYRNDDNRIFDLRASEAVSLDSELKILNLANPKVTIIDSKGETTLLFAKRALTDQEKSTATFYDNVTLDSPKDNMKLYADKLHVDIDARSISSDGYVRIETPNLTLEAKEGLDYSETEPLVVFHGHTIVEIDNAF